MQPPAYFFIAEFEDGDQIWEYEGDTHVHAFQSVIDRLKAGHTLVRLGLIPTRDGLHPIAMTATGAKAIFFRRNYIGIGVPSDAPVTCIGFEKNIGGHAYKSLIFAFDDGSIILTDNHEAV